MYRLAKFWSNNLNRYVDIGHSEIGESYENHNVFNALNLTNDKNQFAFQKIKSVPGCN